MNHIAARSHAPVAQVAPRPSLWLSRALDERANPHPDAPPAPLQPGVREEAERMAEAIAAGLEPAGFDAWREFLRPLTVAVRNPPSQRDFAAFVTAAAGALRTIPSNLLSPERQAEACRRFEFWPSVADLAHWLEPQARPDRERLAVLRRIVSEPDAPHSGRAPLTDEQKAASAAKAQAFAAEMAALVTKEAAPVTARPLAPHHLLAQYEALAAQGNEAAALRAAQLRQAVRP